MDGELEPVALVTDGVLGHLVVDAGEGARRSALTVQDHVCPALQHPALQVQLEETLHRPDPLQIIAAVIDIAVHQAPRRAIHALEGGRVGERPVELSFKQVGQRVAVGNVTSAFGILRQVPQHMVDGPAVAQLDGHLLLRTEHRARRKRCPHSSKAARSEDDTSRGGRSSRPCSAGRGGMGNTVESALRSPATSTR
jgi:hypothetical protein